MSLCKGNPLSLILTLLLLIFLFASAQPNQIFIKKTNSPIKIDGKLDEAAWENATKISSFVEFFPTENGKPAVTTYAYLTYDDKNLYVAFKAFDNPEELRYSLTDRDNIFNDDMVGIIFDTYGNTTWGYEIFVNPIGIQADLKRTSDREDESFDLLFYSDGKITEEGYVVEIAIPFKSLRFPDVPKQKWLIALARMRPRDSRYQYFYPSFDRNNPCMLCQAAELMGIEGIHPGRNIDLIPSFTSNQVSEIRDYDNPDQGMRNEDIMGQLSLTGKMVMNSNMTAEFTINPDFSQVESDEEQIDVNTTFALFYPEKRPFFQEGSDIYDTYFNLLYTRSINDPIAAVKFTSRVGKWDFAYLGAQDQNSPILIPLEENTEFVGNGKSLSNVVRLKRSLGQDSYWGILLSDRRYEGDAYNTVISADFRYLFWKNYRIEFQYFKSVTKEMVDSSTIEDFGTETFGYDNHTIAFDGEKFAGHGIYSNIGYESRNIDFNVDYWESSPGVRADNGFIFQNNYRKTFIEGSYNIFPESKWVDQIRPEFMVARIWNLKGIRKDEWISPAIFMALKGQTHMSIRYLVSRERFKGKDFPGIRRIHFWVNSKFSNVLGFGMSTEIGRSIARTLDNPVLGRLKAVNLWANIKLMNRLFIEPNIQYFNIKYPDRDENIYDGYVLRLRTKFQWNRELFARLIVQYDKFNRDLSIEPLITYQLNPFTIIYLGAMNYQHDYKQPYGFRTTSRQIFFKFQYLWQV